MGYRSEVTFVVSPRKQEVVPFAALKLWFDENYPVMVAKDEWGATIRQKEDAIIVDYEDVKWYPEYIHPKDVGEALHKFTDTFKCEEDSTEFAWEMARVGEDDSDIEIDRSDYNDSLLYVSRSIRVDMAGID